MTSKNQTPAQRVANPVWLRAQIQRLIKECAFHIEEDQALADKARDDAGDRYLERVESHRHWKQQLERILRGKTTNEDLRALLQQEGVAR